MRLKQYNGIADKMKVILSRTVDKFLTRERMLKNLQQWSHRTVDASPSEEAHRLLSKFGGCSNSSRSIAKQEPSILVLSSSLCHSVRREAPTSCAPTCSHNARYHDSVHRHCSYFDGFHSFRLPPDTADSCTGCRDPSAGLLP